MIEFLIVYCIISWVYYAHKVCHDAPEMIKEIGEEIPLTPNQESFAKVALAIGLTFCLAIAPILMLSDIRRYCFVKWRRWKSMRALSRIKKIVTEASANDLGRSGEALEKLKADRVDAQEKLDKLKAAMSKHFDGLLK